MREPTAARRAGADDRGRRARHRPEASPGPAVPGRVLVVGASVGQGHEGAARELARRLYVAGAEVDVRDYLDALPLPVARVLRDLYAPTVHHAPAVFDGIFRALEQPGPLSRLAEWICRQAVDPLAGWSRDADVVVSTYPLAGRTLGQLRRAGRMPATTISYLTDPAAHAFWCDPDVDRHLTVTRATANDAARYGVRAEAAGPLCTARSGDPARRAAVRRELGLPGDVPAVLLAAGSLGMGDVPGTVAAILHHPTAHVLVLCGRNAALRDRLAGRDRVVALGWRDDVPDLMAAADVLVHNAGGLALTEALVAGLPALTYLPIPGHGRANTALLERSGIAAWPGTPAELAAGIERVRATPLPTLPHWPAGADPATTVARALADRLDTPPLASGQ